MRTISHALLFVVVIAALGTGIALAVNAMGNKEAVENDGVTQETTYIEETSGAADQQETVETGVDEKLASLVTPRILGNPDAPIKIEEFASLSCGHCAHFHTTTLPQIKKEYIDTGKAYLVYNDFPLNAPALHGTMAARCIPESRYFDFIKLLFEKQEDWAYQANYRQILGQYSSLLGLGKEAFETCLDNENLKNGLIDNVKIAQEKWKISSTPSFVINDKDVFSGAQGFDVFKEKFDAILKSQTTE